ncbi:TPA: hypothetical protein EYO12_01790 [Candidatus Saccharibacteria bacterium]|nr:hypothetical protein [Candidatus Saccharibacteria bacterium]HIO87449.1 hypothetical protein [Candidatus Saccharibacteria bacterium]
MTAKNFAQLAAGAVVLLLIVHTFTAQAVRRESAEDKRTSAAVTTLSNAVESVYASDYELPQTADEIVLDGTDEKAVEEAKLEYQRISSSAYQICALFNRPSPEADFGNIFNPLAVPDFSDYEFATNYSVDPYEHEAGRVCFEYQAFGGSSYYDYGDSYDDFNFEYDFETPSAGDDYGELEDLFSDPAVLEELNSQLQ